MAWLCLPSLQHTHFALLSLGLFHQHTTPSLVLSVSCTHICLLLHYQLHSLFSFFTHTFVYTSPATIPTPASPFIEALMCIVRYGYNILYMCVMTLTYSCADSMGRRYFIWLYNKHYNGRRRRILPGHARPICSTCLTLIMVEEEDWRVWPHLHFVIIVSMYTNAVPLCALSPPHHTILLFLTRIYHSAFSTHCGKCMLPHYVRAGRRRTCALTGRRK